MTPQFSSFAAFLEMGGHPGFVFGAWGLTAAVILGLVARAIVNGRRAKARFEKMRAGTDA